MSRNVRHNRPRTPSRPLTPGTSRRATAGTGAGDTLPIDLDEELQTVLRKEYDDGENGKVEAIQDVKSVLHQVAQDPMAQKMEEVLPRFLAPPQSAGGTPIIMEDQPYTSRAQTPRNKPAATPRHAKLTARPTSAGIGTGKIATGYKVTEERASVPNIPHEDMIDHRDMRITTSAPTLPDIRYSTASSVYSTEVPSTSSSSSKRKSRSSKTMESSTTADENFSHERHSPRDSQGESGVSSATTGVVTAVSVAGEMHGKIVEQVVKEKKQEGVPFTENLLEITSDTEEAEEIWKSDIVELTRIKSTPKGKYYGGADSLELKYKEPVWPHQLFLNQILAKLPCLTHLVLDGSELRFLRDLGSSLQSLITLSICDCGLQSLDGVYGMPNLRTLIARKNMINIPTQLSFLRKLSYLDLSSNPISSADEFGSLRHCGELRILKLYDTPLAINESNFNKEIKRLVPQLKEIHPSRLYTLFGMPKLMVRTKTADQQKKSKKKTGQNQQWQQMREESKHGGGGAATATTAGVGETNKSRRNDPSVMPSMAYNDVMVDQPKRGIAYQKIETNKTLKEQEQEHRQKESEIKDVSLGTGDFSGIFMAPKFLQHLEETMPPLTEGEEEDEDHDDDGDYVEDVGGSGDFQNVQQEEEKQQDHHHESNVGLGLEANFHQDEKLPVLPNKKSDRALHHHHRQHSQQQEQHSTKNHPGGDGDSGCY